MQSFDFQHRTRFVFGPGVLDRLGDLASEVLAARASRRVLVVSDPGVVSAGHFDRGLRGTAAIWADCRVVSRTEGKSEHR